MRVNVSLDPENIDDKSLWTATQGVGLGLIDVATDDPNFYLGTYYYVSIEQLDAFGVLGSLSLS